MKTSSYFKLLAGVFCLLVLNATYGFAELSPYQNTTTTSTPTTSTTSGSTSTSSTSTTPTGSLAPANTTLSRAPTSHGPTLTDAEKKGVNDVVLARFQGQWPSGYNPVYIRKDSDTQFTASLSSQAKIDLNGDGTAETPVSKYVFTVNKSGSNYWIALERYYENGRLMHVYDRRDPAKHRSTYYNSGGQITRQLVTLYENGGISSITDSTYVNGKLDYKHTLLYTGGIITTRIDTDYSVGVIQHKTTTTLNANGVATKEVYSKYFSNGKVAEKITTEYSTTLMTDASGRKYYPATVQSRSVYNTGGARIEYSVARFNARGYRKSFSGFWFSDTGVKTGIFSAGYSDDGKSMLSWTSRKYHPGTTVIQYYDRDDHVARKRYHKQFDTNGNQMGETQISEAPGPVNVENLRVIRPA